MLSDLEFLGHGLVAETDGLVVEFHQPRHAEQPTGQRIFGVKQSDVGACGVEVVIKNTVVEQQLHVVLLHRLDAIVRCVRSLDEHVASRLLLNE